MHTYKYVYIKKYEDTRNVAQSVSQAEILNCLETIKFIKCKNVSRPAKLIHEGRKQFSGFRGIDVVTAKWVNKMIRIRIVLV